MKKAFFFAVSNNPNIDDESKANYEYSNFVYSICLHSLNILNNSIENQESKYDIDLFKRHDMLTVDNIRDNVYKCMVEYNTFIVLIDQDNKSYNANVWFELGIIATQKNKNIILISKDITKKFPFYISDVDVVIIDKPIYEWFNKNRNIFDSLDKIEFTQDKSLFDDLSNESLKNSITRLENKLIHKLVHGKNPFQTQVSNSQVNALGYGNIRELFENKNIKQLFDNDSTVAEFINGEDAAFNKLVEAVQTANFSLRTTRSANQSIVDKNSSHQKFMSALYQKSQTLEKFDRLICNNNYAKWVDIRDMLLKGGKNTKVFIRKRYCALGFELVVIDEKISFIHFYQLTDSSRYLPRNTSKPNTFNETINSTLKITSENVSKKLADLFDRFHHRDFNNKEKEPNNPSSTLLGIPEQKDIKKDYSGMGYLKLNKDLRERINKAQEQEDKEQIVNDYLFKKFKQWFANMSIEDRIIMGVGISKLNREYAEEILEKIDTYFPENINKGNPSEKEADGREDFKNELIDKKILTKQHIDKITFNNKTKYYDLIEGSDVTEKDIKYLLEEIDTKYFTNIDLFTLEKCLKWHKYNPQIYTILKKHGTNEILGYTNIIPIKDKCYEQLREGLYADIKIIDENIIAYRSPGAYSLYFVSLATNNTSEEFTNYLIYSFIEKLINLAEEDKFVKRVLFRPITKTGKDVCDFYEMKFIKNVKITNIPNTVSIYEVELDSPHKIDNFMRKIPNTMPPHIREKFGVLYKRYFQNNNE